MTALANPSHCLAAGLRRAGTPRCQGPLGGTDRQTGRQRQAGVEAESRRSSLASPLLRQPGHASMSRRGLRRQAVISLPRAAGWSPASPQGFCLHIRTATARDSFKAVSRGGRCSKGSIDAALSHPRPIARSPASLGHGTNMASPGQQLLSLYQSHQVKCPMSAALGCDPTHRDCPSPPYLLPCSWELQAGSSQ